MGNDISELTLGQQLKSEFTGDLLFLEKVTKNSSKINIYLGKLYTNNQHLETLPKIK